MSVVDAALPLDPYRLRRIFPSSRLRFTATDNWSI